MNHFRAHGARKTYLASTCAFEVANGEQARATYVMPKYTLQLPWMRSCVPWSSLKLVRMMCVDTSGFAELTPSFTCQKVAMLDIHLDFVTGGGWSEHAIFLSQLMAAWNK